jgi:anaerobic magnesium-protoporphyrin IX monomethyl ester cyclase
MPDILLIQPPVRDFYLTEKRTIPYGLACIAAELIQNGFTVGIMDGLAVGKSRVIEPPPEMDYLKAFYGKPDVSPFGLFHSFKHFGYSFEHIGKTARDSGAFLVGISSLFTAYSDEAIAVARTVKAFHPRCRVVMGGHHATALPEAVMAEGAVDFVIRGEAETAMPLLARALRDGQAISGIPGIVFRKPDRTLAISLPAELNDLDDHPLPARHLINHAFYRRNKKGSTVVLTSRGCPMKCTYCAVGGGTVRYRVRSTARVVQEIETAVTEYGARFIDFEDENLSLDRTGFLSLLDEIARRFHGVDLELRAMNGLFTPSLDETEIRAMKTAGFRALNLSLGTTDPEQLRRFRRPDVRKATETAFQAARKHGLDVVCYIIVGAPGQSARNSLEDLLYLAARDVLAGVSVYYPAPGSADYAMLEKGGMLPEHFSLMRSAVLPISHRSTRRESVTLLRLGRILGFIRSLTQRGEALPLPAALDASTIDPRMDRGAVGKQLLSGFLHDGRIHGMTSRGEIYEHNVSLELTRSFKDGLKNIFG